MLETIVALVALFGIIILILVKIYNVTAILSNKPLLDNKGTFFTLIGVLLCWVLYFVAFAGSLQYAEQIASTTETYVITSNAFVSFAFFLPLMNLFLVLGVMLTVIEVVAMFANIHTRGRRN